MSAGSDPPRRRHDTTAECGDEEIEDLKRRLAERDARLAKIEERLSLITEATSDGVYEWNIETDDLTISPKLFDMFGMPGIGQHEITPELWASRIHPEEFAAYRAAMVSHFKGETDLLRTTYRVRDEKGGMRWAAENGIAVRDESGRAVRLVSAISDITERKQAETKLRESEGLLSAVMDHIPQTIILKDLEGRYVLVNEAGRKNFLKVCGTDDLMGLTSHDVFEKDIADRMRELDLVVLQSEAPIAEEVTYNKTANGDDRSTITVKFPIRDDEGNCPSSKHSGLLSLFFTGGSGSSWFDVKPLVVDGSSGVFERSVF